MGAWGHGSFDNDDAADWVGDFERNGVAAVVTMLQHVSNFGEDDYLEAPDASAAIAAAEVVASAHDGELSNLSQHARNVFTKYQHALTDPHLLETARRAVKRILRQSELKDLWEEGAGPESALWSKALDSLSSRLGAR